MQGGICMIVSNNSGLIDWVVNFQNVLNKLCSYSVNNDDEIEDCLYGMIFEIKGGRRKEYIILDTAFYFSPNNYKNNKDLIALSTVLYNLVFELSEYIESDIYYDKLYNLFINAVKSNNYSYLSDVLQFKFSNKTAAV